MPPENITPEKGPVYELAGEIPGEQVLAESKQKILRTYTRILRLIYDRILPTLGQVTLLAIMERALAMTAERHPLVRHLQLTTAGLSFQDLYHRVGLEDEHGLREALKDLVTNLLDILVMLTGDILVQGLLQEIKGEESG
jgi:hypothetical protein